MPFSGDFNPADFNPQDFFDLQVTGTTGPPVPSQKSNVIGLFDIGISPIGDIPAFNLWNTVISQYANSPILTTLIKNWFNYLDQTQQFSTFFDFIMNLDTAQGYGLDLWGRILGISRILNVSSSVSFGFAQASPTVQGFDQAPFFVGQTITNNFSLSDSAFRTLLIAKALANITPSTIPALNQILLTLFPGRGNAFVTDTTPTTNLLLQSNNFTAIANWLASNVVGTANSGTSPDGTNDAWLVQRTQAAPFCDFQQTVNVPLVPNPVPYTFSVYAKRSSGRYVVLFLDNVGSSDNSVQATFDLQVGVISKGPFQTGGTAPFSASISPAANGFYRCAVTGYLVPTGQVRGAFIGNSNNGLLGDTDSSSSSSILAFGSQMEQNSQMGPYVSTTTAQTTSTSPAPMSMNYTFEFLLTAVEQSIVLSSGVLPKPAGVALTIVQV